MSEQHVILGLKANLKQAKLQYKKQEVALIEEIAAQAKEIAGLRKQIKYLLADIEKRKDYESWLQSRSRHESLMSYNWWKEDGLLKLR